MSPRPGGGGRYHRLPLHLLHLLLSICQHMSSFPQQLEVLQSGGDIALPHDGVREPRGGVD